MNDVIDIKEWKQKLKNFIIERDWLPYHNPKNLAMSISAEAAELLENYTWVSTTEANTVHQDPEKLLNIRHELGDILMGVIMLADELDINLNESLTEKLEFTEKKYPANNKATV